MIKKSNYWDRLYIEHYQYDQTLLEELTNELNSFGRDDRTEEIRTTSDRRQVFTAQHT